MYALPVIVHVDIGWVGYITTATVNAIIRSWYVFYAVFNFKRDNLISDFTVKIVFNLFLKLETKQTLVFLEAVLS